MSIYKITCQDEEDTVKEFDYVVGWDPDKVEIDEVARACAIEKTYLSGKCSRNGQPSFKSLWQPISHELIVAESVLAE